MNHRILTVLSVLLCLGVTGLHARASGPSSNALSDLPVETVGSGVLKWFGIEVYEASLFTESGDFRGLNENETLALQLRYLRNIPADRLVSRTRKEWDRLASRTALPASATREAWLSAVAEIWPDIARGDLIITVVTPGGPTRFYDSGNLLGEVSDPAFGPAFLQIWLHPDSRSRDLRNRLVGEAR